MKTDCSIASAGTSEAPCAAVEKSRSASHTEIRTLPTDTAISYRPCEPQQEMVLPASLQDWLPKGHLAYSISDTVDALDLKAFYARYAGGGARN